MTFLTELAHFPADFSRLGVKYVSRLRVLKAENRRNVLSFLHCGPIRNEDMRLFGPDEAMSMTSPPHSSSSDNTLDVTARLRDVAPYLWTSLFWILVGGLLSAATANTPTRVIMWMSAYLTLVGGVVHAALFVGQAHLARILPSPRLSAIQSIVFHLGSAAVIGGVLTRAQWLTNVGTLVFDLSLLMFFMAVQDARKSRWLWPYRLAIAFVGVSSVVGIFLSLMIEH